MSSGFDSEWLRDREARTVKLGAAPPNAETDEAKLHAQIIEECKRRSWIVFHGSMAHSTFRTKGEPDFQILADKGRLFLIECKSKTGKLSPEQCAIILWADRLNHKVHVVRSYGEFIDVIAGDGVK
jgi:hypothetical protein